MRPATNDGYELATYDMRIREIGDVSAMDERRHGSAGGLLMNGAGSMLTLLDVLEAMSAL